MPNFPFFRSPFNNYRYYYPYYGHMNRPINNFSSNYSNNINSSKNVCLKDLPKKNDTHEKNESHFNFNNSINNTSSSSKRTQIGPVLLNFSGFDDVEQPLLEIMGLKLYLDDIIIIGILFFLYNEGVKDDILFISLILLLLS